MSGDTTGCGDALFEVSGTKCKGTEETCTDRLWWSRVTIPAIGVIRSRLSSLRVTGTGELFNAR
jgi:hypothetical protein